MGKKRKIIAGAVAVTGIGLLVAKGVKNKKSKGIELNR